MNNGREKNKIQMLIVDELTVEPKTKNIVDMLYGDKIESYELDYGHSEWNGGGYNINYSNVKDWAEDFNERYDIIFINMTAYVFGDGEGLGFDLAEQLIKCCPELTSKIILLADRYDWQIQKMGAYSKERLENVFKSVRTALHEENYKRQLKALIKGSPAFQKATMSTCDYALDQDGLY